MPPFEVHCLQSKGREFHMRTRHTNEMETMEIRSVWIYINLNGVLCEPKMRWSKRKEKSQ